MLLLREQRFKVGSSTREKDTCMLLLHNMLHCCSAGEEARFFVAGLVQDGHHMISWQIIEDNERLAL